MPAPEIDQQSFRPGAQVVLNESLNVVEVLEPDRAGEVVKVKDRLGEDRVIVVGRGDEEHVAHLAGSLLHGTAARRRQRPVRPTLQRGHRAPAQGRGRGARPRGDPRRQLRRHRRPRRPDRFDPRRRGAAVPVRRAVRRARAGGPQGRPALRTSRLRQDADREGGREVAGREGGRTHRPQRRTQLLPERQGAGAAEQVRRRDRASDPRDLHPGEGAQRGGSAGHRVLRRDGLDLPHARHGHLERRRVHDRAAAAQRARRRRDPEERDRDRRLEPRGPDRPRHPAAWPARREDQDRAAHAGPGRRHHGQVPAPGRADPPRRGRRATAAMPSRPATA